MHIKYKTWKSRIFDAVLILVFTLFSASVLYPFVCELLRSFSGESHILAHGYSLTLGNFTTRNWQIILNSTSLWRSFFNTVAVTAGYTAYSLFLSVTFAYPLSRRDLPHRNVFTVIMVFTMFFSGGLVPTYVLMYNLKLVNNMLVLVIGAMNAWNTIIIRNFFMAVPASIQESARIDGASEVTILGKIMLPLSLPVLATVTLWNMVNRWNAWVDAMIYIRTPAKQVLQIVLRQLIFQNQSFASADEFFQQMALQGDRVQMTSEGLKSTTLLFVIAPIILTYPFLQRYFIKGIFVGSLKG